MRWVPNFRFSLRVSLPLTITVLLALPLAGWGQQELRSGKKGVTVPAPVTSTAVDADTQALDVAIKAGSITLSGADGAIQDGVTPSIRATVKNYTNSKPLTVVTVDTNGDPVSAGGGGTQYTEDAPSVADPVGTQTICRRRDTPATETTTDGDNTAANCTGKGELYIKHIDPIAVTQSGVWTVQQGTPPWAMKPDGTVWTLTGTSANVSVTNSVAVTGTFWQATQPISASSLPLPTGASTLAEQQTQTTALQLIDNLPLAQSAATAGQSGVLAMGAVTTAAPTYTTGNTNPISLQTDGSQRVAVTNTLTVTQATAANLNTRTDTSGATGAAPPARADFVGGLASGATGGFVTGFAVCDSFVNVNVSTATTTLLVTGVSGRHVRICSMSLVTLAANNVALLSGTGATCGTGTTGMTGGTTAATGWNFAANGGITQGAGLGVINQTNATGDSVCIATSAATQLSGRISYAVY